MLHEPRWLYVVPPRGGCPGSHPGLSAGFPWSEVTQCLHFMQLLEPSNQSRRSVTFCALCQMSYTAMVAAPGLEPGTSPSYGK